MARTRGIEQRLKILKKVIYKKYPEPRHPAVAELFRRLKSAFKDRNKIAHNPYGVRIGKQPLVAGIFVYWDDKEELVDLEALKAINAEASTLNGAFAAVHRYINFGDADVLNMVLREADSSRSINSDPQPGNDRPQSD